MKEGRVVSHHLQASRKPAPRITVVDMQTSRGWSPLVGVYSTRNIVGKNEGLRDDTHE